MADLGLRPQGDPKIPLWAWLFVVVCGLIMTVRIGLIPGLIGGMGAACCIVVARNPKQSVALRVGLCAGVCAVAWAVFGALLLITG